jgi:hypothetical protein
VPLNKQNLFLKKTTYKMASKGNNKQQNKTIVLRIEEEEYSSFINDKMYARQLIDKRIAEHPELFPKCIKEKGYKLNGRTRESKKTGYSMLKIATGGEQYQIQPAFILSYMRGMTDDASKAMFLLKFNVPYWALAYVFGRNHMYWYRLSVSLGTYSIVGTTVKCEELLPEDLLADEEHITIKGKKSYIGTTVAQGCILGAEVSKGCGDEDLKEAYGVFKEEAQDVKSDYSPVTVNTDGWSATKNAWKSLFPKIVIIQCFLHAYIKIRDRALKKMQDVFQEIGQKVWDCYKATDKRSFSQRIRRLKQWAKNSVPESIMKDKLLDLCSKCNLWIKFYDFPKAYRTSNALDRLMKFMNRHKFAHQGYHSSVEATNLNIRAYALIYNFAPSCPETRKNHSKMESPFERLNKFKYHENWLQNLLIAASLGGYRNQHSKT